MITSRQNQRIKDVVRLRERRERNRRQEFLVEGVREIDRAVRAGVPMVELFVAPELAKGEAAAMLLEMIERRALSCHEVTRAVFEKLAYGDRTEGVLAVARMAPRTLDDLALPSRPLVAVLEGVEKPGNLGAIARSADATGVSALVVAGYGTDVYNPNAIRASLGTLFSVPLVEAEADPARNWAMGLGVPVFAARPDAGKLYSDVTYSGGAVIVLGSEAEGLSPIWRHPDVTPIRIPMYGVGDSLNVSATAAVLFFEALRQRQS